MKYGSIIQGLVAALLAAVSSSAHAGIADLSGHFEGGYTCVQGNTWLGLDLKPHTDGSIDGTFAFGGVEWTDESGRHSNEVASGKFALRGNWSGNHFVLRPAYWIEQPDGFTMVGITGDSDGSRITGTVDFEGCTIFGVNRR